MTAAPPGCYRDGQGLMRWWDGREWSDPFNDPRLRPGTPTVIDSARLTFVPDTRWPAAPSGWYPPPMWQPEPGWPEPDDYLWSVAGLNDATLVADLDPVLEILEQEATTVADLWRLDSHDSIPFVWVAPPNWPTPTPGWSPPDRWKAPRHWGPAPKGWQFWQQDPNVIDFKTAAIHAKADERSRALVRSTAGIATLLSLAESTVCQVTRLTPLTLSPLPSAARNGFPVTAPSDLAQSLKAAHDELNWHVSNLRIYLLRLAYGLGQPDEWLWQLRRAVVEGKQRYQTAAKAAGEGVLNETVAHVSRDVKRLKPRQIQRQERLKALLPELRADMTARVRAVGPEENQFVSEIGEPNVAGPSDWELAEVLAAEHLRNLGFKDAQRTPAGSDGGFDVEGRGVVAQVKYHAAAVGRPDVQRLVGANRHGARSVFYARTGYTQNAMEFAEQAGVALFILDTTTSSAEPVNGTARGLSTAI